MDSWTFAVEDGPQGPIFMAFKFYDSEGGLREESRRGGCSSVRHAPRSCLQNKVVRRQRPERVSPRISQYPSGQLLNLFFCLYVDAASTFKHAFMFIRAS